jgi:hypothetical protein
VSAEASARPLVRVVVGNALTLAAVYLGVGVLVESLRRLYPSRSVLTLSFALDALPAQVLSLCGLLDPLREYYLAGRLSEAGLRAIFGVTALAAIFLLATLLGLVGAGLRAAIRCKKSFGE